MSGKTDILVVGKEVVVLCAEGSRAVILRKTRRVNGIIALELALSAPHPTPPKKNCVKAPRHPGHNRAEAGKTWDLFHIKSNT